MTPPQHDGPARGMGQRLRQLRTARGKSQRVVAGLAGLSHSYLSELETGTKPLDKLSHIIALSSALEVAPAELIGPLLSTSDHGRALPCGRCGHRCA